jgi:hypothetical protein
MPIGKGLIAEFFMRRHLTRQRRLVRCPDFQVLQNFQMLQIGGSQTIAAEVWDSSILTVKSVQTNPRFLETNDGSGAYTSELLLPFLWPSDLCGVCLRRTVFKAIHRDAA